MAANETRLTESPAQPREIRAGQNYFEHIDGQAQVFSGFVYMQQYLERTSGKTALDPSLWRTNYLTRLFTATNRLQLGGIDHKATGPEAEACLNLSEIYTALLTLSAEEDRRERPTEQTQERHRSALDLLNTAPRLVLLGDPGSGKSTFVKFVTVCLAGEMLGDVSVNLDRLTAPLPDDDGQATEERQPWQHGALLPVSVILRDFAARGLPPQESPATARHLWEFIVRSLDDMMLGEYAPHLARQLWESGGLVCLDGLDEVPEAGKRRVQIKQVVEDFGLVFPKCRILVTSRTYAYQQQDWRLQQFTETVLAPFTPGQIRRFVDGWYRHSAEIRGKNLDDAQGRSELLKHAIFTNSRLHDFARRPLLLTLMASLHAWRGGSLPERRVDLYAEATDLLLEWWERDKVVRDADGTVMVTQPSLTEMLRVRIERVREVLNRLAFEAHVNQLERAGSADIPETHLIKALMRICRNEDVNPMLLIRYVSDRAGLVVSRGVEVYTFPHRTFQEYLTACYLFQQDEYPDNIAELARSDPNRWREVVLLAAGLGPPRDVWSLVDALCQSDFVACQPPGADAWGALFAGQVVTETLDVNQIVARHRATISRIQQWLIAILTERLHAEEPFPVTERALAGNLLAQLGDPRPGVALHDDGVPDIAWCDVPSGEFLMGSDPEQDSEAYGDEHPQHPVHLSAYRISRYPVTNAQYNAFVKNGGYNREELWTPEGWEWKQTSGIPGPAMAGREFDLPNHPVVGVSWYEAISFCAWLTARLRESGELAIELEVRLPTEAEWEKAARGPDGRIYPWGSQADPELMNYNDTDLGVTSTVGCFPRGISPYGCEDMVGNVWEWCWDWYDGKYYQKSPKKDPRGPVTGSRRVIRGGYWGSDAIRCRSAARFGWLPDDRGDFIGFRLLRTPA